MRKEFDVIDEARQVVQQYEEWNLRRMFNHTQEQYATRLDKHEFLREYLRMYDDTDPEKMPPEQ